MREFHPSRRQMLRECLWLANRGVIVMMLLLVAFRTLDLWNMYGLAQMLEFPWFMLQSYTIYVLIWLGYVVIITLLYYARLSRDKAFDVPHRYGFDEEGIYIDIAPLLRSHISWERFNGWRENRRVICLLTGNVVILWHKKIWLEEELEAIRGHLRRLAAPRKVWLKRGKCDQATP